MNFNAYFSNDLSRLLNQFDITTVNFIIKPNFTQVCAGTTDKNSLEQLFRTLVELPVKPEIQLVEIPNVNAPPLRQVIKDLNLVETLKKYGVRVVYLDEQTRPEYGQYLSLRIPNLLLERREEVKRKGL